MCRFEDLKISYEPLASSFELEGARLAARSSQLVATLELNNIMLQIN
jgi:hypothetical protein